MMPMVDWWLSITHNIERNMPANWKSSPMIASVALVGVTAVWGYTFLVVQDAIARMPVMDFLAWRLPVCVT